MTNRDWIWIVILGLGWGASFFFNEILLREVGPLTVSALRVGVAALGCWAYLAAIGQDARVPGRVLGQTAVFGLLMFGLPFAIYPVGQQFVASGVAGIVNALTPIMVVIVSQMWPGGEKATRLKSLGVLCGFFGIVLLTLPALQSGEGSRLFGILFLVLAPVCYALATNYVRRLHGLSPVILIAWGFSWATLGIGGAALVREGVPRMTMVETWAAAAVLGLVLTAAAFIVFFRLLPRVGATRMSTVTFVAPVSAVLIGWGILAEDIGLLHLAGMAAIFLGLLLIDGRLFAGRPKLN